MPFQWKTSWKMYFEEFIFSPFWTYACRIRYRAAMVTDCWLTGSASMGAARSMTTAWLAMTGTTVGTRWCRVGCQPRSPADWQRARSGARTGSGRGWTHSWQSLWVPLDGGGVHLSSLHRRLANLVMGLQQLVLHHRETGMVLGSNIDNWS